MGAARPVGAHRETGFKTRGGRPEHWLTIDAWAAVPRHGHCAETTMDDSTRSSVPATPTEEPDASRRRITWMATGVGGVGVVAASVPFVASFAPSERARALGAPVAVSIAHLPEEKRMTVEWRGKPVWILHRSPDQLKRLQSKELQALLVDPMSHRAEQQPAYAANPFRSIRPEFGVYVAICTHLGCIPTYRPDVDAPDLRAGWPGGFFCPCHGSYFDLAARVYRNVPAPTNLEVPPYRFISDTVIEIGVDPT